MSGLLDGKRLVITGVITESSIAYAVARLAQQEGAHIVLTAYGRTSLVQRLARRLPHPPPVVELDVTAPDQLAQLAPPGGEPPHRGDRGGHARPPPPPPQRHRAR
ncbi:SDR family oxidoreductase, partial [Streptomyces sp. NPDC059552]|uniref:SDR family oxidoreductase n=1 Tax=Streptomyces sp. NPDC059552 TaxID=3346862 RepID=UPI0036763C7F